MPPNSWLAEPVIHDGACVGLLPSPTVQLTGPCGPASVTIQVDENGVHVYVLVCTASHQCHTLYIRVPNACDVLCA